MDPDSRIISIEYRNIGTLNWSAYQVKAAHCGLPQPNPGADRAFGILRIMPGSFPDGPVSYAGDLAREDSNYPSPREQLTR